MKTDRKPIRIPFLASFGIVMLIAACLLTLALSSLSSLSTLALDHPSKTDRSKANSSKANSSKGTFSKDTSSNADPSKADLRFTILHTNDLHAHSEPFSERGKVLGGLARIGHIIRSYRKQNPNTLVIDAGDIFQGTTLFTRYLGEVEVYLLNKIGYDIYTIGNHEFDGGAENLAKQLSAARFDIIDCNVDAAAVPALAKLIKPSVVKKIDGKDVAFIGVMTPELERLCLTLDGVKMAAKGDGWIDPVRREVERRKKEGITRIVLVTHCGVDYDQQLAKALPDVDVIVGGHSHTRLDEPVFVDQPDGATTMIVQAHCYGRTLGKLELAFDAKGRLVVPDVEYRLINITAKIEEEPDLKAYVDEKVKPLLALRHDIVAQAEGDFDNRWYLMPWDSAIGNLICDALAEAGQSYGVQIAFQNRGGIRGRIDKGPITQEKIEEILPFDNRLTFATISGESVLRAIEHSVSGPTGGRFLDVHGLKIAYDPSRPRGQRLVYALVQDKKGAWVPVDPSGEYKIAVNSYTFKSGEGYDFADAKDIHYFPDKIALPFRKYLKDHKKVTPIGPERIIPITSLGAGVNKGELSLSGLQPGSRITIVAGTARGIGTIFDSLPVPVEKPKVIKSGLRAGESSSFSTMIANELDDNKQMTFVTAVVQPPKSQSRRKTLMSYPLSLDQNGDGRADLEEWKKEKRRKRGSSNRRSQREAAN